MNDETLLLYYYEDGLSDAERREVERALESDPALRARYDELRRDMAALPAPEAIIAPPDLVERFHAGLERVANLERGREPQVKRSTLFPSFAWGSVVAAALVVGIGIGSFLTGNGVVDPGVPPTPVPKEASAVPPGTGSPFTRGLQVHFAKSREDLSNLKVEESAERQMLIMHIIQQNRLFMREANENASPDLARVLRAFEPILVKLAAEDITPAEAARLQAKLAFELNVMLTKLGQSPSESKDDATESI